MTAQVRTVDGRIAGRRGQETRQKLLDCLREMLSTSAYRDVKVIDVARMAGTSPATFYQYFPDIEGAVLELAEEMAKEGAGLTDLVAGRTWAGKAGAAAAEELVDGFFSFWRKHEAILRVVDLAAAEGDKRFFKIRTRVLTSVTSSLADSIKQLQDRGRGADKTLSPQALALSLVAMLSSVAGQQRSLQTWGVKQAELKPAVATLIHLGVTGRKPPK